MDTRIALKRGTVLGNHNQGFCYEIKGEVARGGSCIVYDALYRMENGQQKLVKLKECYPFHLNILRKEDGSILAEGDGALHFERAKNHLRNAFFHGNSLFMTKGLTNVTTNMLHCFEENNTVYIPSATLDGTVLTADTFASLKDCVQVMITVSQVLEQIHQAGYLYLDLKPDNIFVLTNTEGKGATELVQLFDFDSLMELATLQNPVEHAFRIPYTQRYAALELQMGNVHRFGYFTDVYSVGAVLFYLIFERAPQAMDCEEHAVYEFSRSRFGTKEYPDKLFFLLTDFFHRTLASYRLDRYETMADVIVQLKEIVKLADQTIPFLKSTRILRETNFIGRAREKQFFEKWLFGSHEPCMFLTGMGGIGKSSFARKCISQYVEQLDSVLYLSYKESLQEMLVDDFHVSVNTVERDQDEDVNQYFLRKLKAISRLLQGKRALLVIDDFCGELTREFQQILQVGWKVLVISRKQPPSERYHHLALKELATLEEQCYLFQTYLGYCMEQDAFPYFQKIANCVQGHTLVLELLAKQIGRSCLTLKEAASLIEELGFADSIPEKIRHEKDCETRSGTVRELISHVFFFHEPRELKRRTLKMLSLFSLSGIEIDVLGTMLSLSTRDVLYELEEEGWVYLRDGRCLLHPVIREVVEGWEWKQEELRSAGVIFLYLSERLRKEKAESPMLALAAAVVESSYKQSQLRQQEAFATLSGLVLLYVSVEQETFITKHMRQFVQHSFVKDAHFMMRLYKRWLSVLLEQGKLDEATVLLKETGSYTRGRDCYVKAQYYDMLGDFYNERLDGAYACDNVHSDLIHLMRAIDRAILYMKMAHGERKDNLLCEYMIEKANVMIRSMPEKRRAIHKMLRAIEQLGMKCFDQWPDLKRNYCMTRAFYYTLVEPDEKLVKKLCKCADELVMQQDVPDIERIDLIYVPFANMMAELGDLDYAENVLLQAIRLCDEYADLTAYQRKKTLLCKYLLDVEFWKEDVECCRKLVWYIDGRNAEREEYDRCIEVDEEIRAFIR